MLKLLALPLILVGFVACEGEPGLWENTQKSDYEPYCTIEYCDMIEQSAEPECRCPCKDDSDLGDDDGDGGGGDGGGGDGGGGGSGGDGGGDGGGGDCDTCDDGDGCTLTQGYWKNHNQFRTQPRQAIDWPAPWDESQLMCGQKLLDILNTPTRGEAWYILAHQYIAASLNAASGAASAEVDAALAESRAILTANCAGITADRQNAIDLSYLLDSYNNGLIGPGHCD